MLIQLATQQEELGRVALCRWSKLLWIWILKPRFHDRKIQISTKGTITRRRNASFRKRFCRLWRLTVNGFLPVKEYLPAEYFPQGYKFDGRPNPPHTRPLHSTRGPQKLFVQIEKKKRGPKRRCVNNFISFGWQVNLVLMAFNISSRWYLSAASKAMNAQT